MITVAVGIAAAVICAAVIVAQENVQLPWQATTPCA
jgi:hypothetical protein